MLLGLETNFLLAFFLTLGLWLIIFVELLSRHYGEQMASLGKEQFEKNTRPVSLNLGLETKLRESFAPRRRNVVAYSGYEPFAGAGYNLGGWSFVIDTTRGACSKLLQGKRDKPQPFMLNELYTAVRQRLEGLGLGDALEIEEKLYINGQHVRENPSFFDETALRPLASVDQQLVEQFKEQPTEDTRYYQCIRFSFWRGEVVLSVFLRFVRRGSELFVEIDYLLLPPLLSAYHWMDQKKVVPTASKVWELFKRSFDAPIKLWFGSFRRLLRASTYQAQQRRLARVARRSLSFDYGAATSLRQVASDSKYHHFFQKLDKEMYLKIAERQLLESIMQFLDEHCIDTTELRQRQEAILNTGVIVGGDTINIGSVASGSRVQATTVNTAYSAAALAGQERMRWD